HHRLGVGARNPLIPIVANVERVDIRYDLAAVREPVEFTLEPFGLFLGAPRAGVLDRFAERVEFPCLGPPQRNPPRHAVAHRPADAEIGWAAGDLITGAL